MPSKQFLTVTTRYQAGETSAFAALVDLARSGDPDAQFVVSEFRLMGVGGPCNVTEAKAFVEAAADAGHVEARRANAYFVAAGIGTDPDPATARQMLQAVAGEDRFVATQLVFLGHVNCRERARSAVRRKISSDPQIEIVQGLFSKEECRYLQVLATPWLKPAKVYSEGGGTRLENMRDAHNMGFSPVTEDLVVQEINRCIADVSGFPYAWGEPLQVVRYLPGQQFRPHHDAHGSGGGATKRVASALLYLNDAYEGGETHFPEMGIRVRGAIGDVLIFHNLTADGSADPRMIHAGLPVTRGEKWLATRWIRTRDYIER